MYNILLLAQTNSQSNSQIWFWLLCLSILYIIYLYNSPAIVFSDDQRKKLQEVVIYSMNHKTSYEKWEELFKTFGFSDEDLVEFRSEINKEYYKYF